MLTLLLACSSEPTVEVAPITDAEASEAAAAIICEAAAEAELECTTDGANALVAGATVTPAVHVSGFVALPGTTIGMGASAQEIPGETQLTGDLTLAVDGVDLFTTSISHAASDLDPEVARQKVLDEAVERWMVANGLPVLDALADDADAGALKSVGMAAPAGGDETFSAWGAYPVLRGQGLDPKTSSRMGPGLTSMLAAMAPYVDGLEPGLHSVLVEAKLGGSGGPGPCGVLPPMVTSGQSTSIVPLSGSVTVDGQVTGSICDLSEAVAWPLPPSGSTIEWDQRVIVRVR